MRECQVGPQECGTSKWLPVTLVIYGRVSLCCRPCEGSAPAAAAPLAAPSTAGSSSTVSRPGRVRIQIARVVVRAVVTADDGSSQQPQPRRRQQPPRSRAHTQIVLQRREITGCSRGSSNSYVHLPRRCRHLRPRPPPGRSASAAPVQHSIIVLCAHARVIGCKYLAIVPVARAREREVTPGEGWCIAVTTTSTEEEDHCRRCCPPWTLSPLSLSRSLAAAESCSCLKGNGAWKICDVVSGSSRQPRKKGRERDSVCVREEVSCVLCAKIAREKKRGRVRNGAAAELRI